MTFWKNITTRFKRKLSYEDMRRICIEFAEPGLEVEPISTAFDKLIEIDSSKSWFWQWQLDISPSLKKIADANSHETQALQCRIEIMKNLERLAIKSFILEIEEPVFKDFLLILEYSDVSSLSKKAHRSQLILDYAFTLLTDLGFTGLYEQKFEQYLPLDDFSKPYNAICRVYFEIFCYTSFWNEVLTENKNPDVQSTAAIYLDNISSRMLNVLREAKEDFETWIKAGHADGIEVFKERLLKLAEEYYDSHESVQKTIETWPEYINRKNQNGV